MLTFVSHFFRREQEVAHAAQGARRRHRQHQEAVVSRPEYRIEPRPFARRVVGGRVQERTRDGTGHRVALVSDPVARPHDGRRLVRMLHAGFCEPELCDAAGQFGDLVAQLAAGSVAERVGWHRQWQHSGDSEPRQDRHGPAAARAVDSSASLGSAADQRETERRRGVCERQLPAHGAAGRMHEGVAGPRAPERES